MSRWSASESSLAGALQFRRRLFQHGVFERVMDLDEIPLSAAQLCFDLLQRVGDLMQHEQDRTAARGLT